MFCSECGTSLEINAKFCQNCGYFTGKEHVPEIKSVVSHTVDQKSDGIKWLKFWNYFSLPCGSILNLFIGYLLFLNFPIVGIFLFLLSFLYFLVIYGLHHRKLWAWQWNWVLISMAFIGMLTPMPGSNDSAGQFVMKLILGILIWMWPNYVYWKKRKSLFSNQSDKIYEQAVKNRQVIKSEAEFSICWEHKTLIALCMFIALVGVILIIFPKPPKLEDNMFKCYKNGMIFYRTHPCNE